MNIWSKFLNVFTSNVDAQPAQTERDRRGTVSSPTSSTLHTHRQAQYEWILRRCNVNVNRAQKATQDNQPPETHAKALYLTRGIHAPVLASGKRCVHLKQQLLPLLALVRACLVLSYGTGLRDRSAPV